MTALPIVMLKNVEVLDDDLWRAYINMQCPDPVMHAMTACCADCENKYIELEGIQNRVVICKLSHTCNTLRSIVDEHNR